MKYLYLILLVVYSITSTAQVVLNEAQSSNSTTLADDMGEFDDWIEIHNLSSDSVEIGGLVLKDQLDTWVIPTDEPSTLIPPNGYFLLWADDQEFQGPFHTNFKLASGGEFLGLYESDGTTVIDSVTLPPMESNDSYIRCIEGWIETSDPTPLNINDCTVGLVEDVNLNEIVEITVINNQLEINITDNFKDEMILSIYSIDGKEVVKESISAANAQLDLGILESNIYVVNITVRGSFYSQKIVIK